MSQIICEFREYNAILVRDKYGYWLRISDENPGIMIKGVCGMPPEGLAIETAKKHLMNSIDNDQDDD